MSVALEPVPQPGILDISPYVGGEGEAGGYMLASNENPLGAGARAREAYLRQADGLHIYPDGAAAFLRDAIAEAHGLDAGRIVCGNGSDELLALLCHAYAGAGNEVIHSEHGFLMYRIATLAAGARPVSVAETNLRADVDRILKAAGDETRIVFLANPNNPTGSWLKRNELRHLRDGLPAHALLVLDAAYAEYVTEPEYVAGVEFVESQRNVVMTRTFSKIHGLAGLRIGWAYCPDRVAAVLHRIRGPFNANAAAQAAAAAAVLDFPHVQASVGENIRNRAFLSRGLSDLGLEVFPSGGNFVLVQFADAHAAGEADAALRRRRVFVRRMDAYGLPACLRVTVGAEEAIRAILSCLSEHIGEE